MVKTVVAFKNGPVMEYESIRAILYKNRILALFGVTRSNMTHFTDGSKCTIDATLYDEMNIKVLNQDAWEEIISDGLTIYT